MLMAATKVWTLEELDALPDDSNKYELVHGELLVTPAPGGHHGEIAANLNRILVPYVIAHDLGLVYFPRDVIQRDGSQLEPDLMVRERGTGSLPRTSMPAPILVVEILSPSTRRHDRETKRAFYLEIGVTEYWIVDPTTRAITSVWHGRPDTITTSQLIWHPAGASSPLLIDVESVFDIA